MSHFVVITYFLSIAVGTSALVLFLIIYIKSKIELIGHYVVFQLLCTIYILLQFFNIYMRTIVKYLTPDFYIFVNFLYFVWYIFFIYKVPVFFHNLAGVKFTDLRKAIFGGMSLISLVLLIIPFMITGIPLRILRLMEFELQNICYPIFIITWIYSIYIIWSNREKVENEINKKVINTVLIICLVFLPGFVLDPFFYRVPEIIPAGFEFSTVFYFVWNTVSIIYVARYFNLKTGISQDPKGLDDFAKKHSISKRENEILCLILDGLDSRTIGEKLFLSDRTVRNHISSIYRKVGCKNRVELIKKIARL